MSDRNYIDDLAAAIRSATPQALLPEDEQDLDALFRLYALIALVKGEAITERDVHDAWSVWMVSRGEGHESVVPFEDLKADVQREDRPFVDAIHEAVRGSQ